MATVPIVTDITTHVTTWDASGYITAINAHIVATAGTTKLAVDDLNVNEGITIGFLAGGEGQQINLRKSAAAVLQVSCEPSGSITDAGNSTPTAPTGTSADWSGERSWTCANSGTNVGAGSKLWCIEVDDAFFLLTTDTTNTYHLSALHAGRIAFSTNSAGAAAAGQDGLGFIGAYGTAGINTNGGSAPGGWMIGNNDCSTIHWATNEWSDHLIQSITISGGVTASPADTTYRPLPPLYITADDIDGSFSDQLYGTMKYVRSQNGTGSPKARLDDGASNQSWMHVYSTNTASWGPMVIWDKTVTP